MRKIGSYSTVVMSGGTEGSNAYGEIPIFGSRWNRPLRQAQVLVKAFGDYVWINIRPQLVSFLP